MELEPPDSHYVYAAEGWLELGLPKEASEELDRVAPQFADHRDVLFVRLRLHVSNKQWDQGFAIASALTEIAAHHVQVWMYLGNCLQYSGRPQEAFDRISAVVVKFPNNPGLRYNLACYACAMGRLQEAKFWLDEALALDDDQNIKEIALNDPELAALRETIQA